ncbi:MULTISPECIES: hypothetical protein [unclassified Delftia]|nr:MULTISPECIES: hypothetical protein [unclassified Delftia]MCB4788670.1 hypothetical protein [Delftia sp. Lp-1]
MSHFQSIFWALISAVPDPWTGTRYRPGCNGKWPGEWPAGRLRRLA